MDDFADFYLTDARDSMDCRQVQFVDSVSSLKVKPMQDQLSVSRPST